MKMKIMIKCTETSEKVTIIITSAQIEAQKKEKIIESELENLL